MITYGRIEKHEGDRCPACHSSDVKKPKGNLERKSESSWGLSCTVCRYSVLVRRLKKQSLTKWKSKRLNPMPKNRPKIKGIGKECPKCGIPMERREHSRKPETAYFFSEWDYCKPCNHVQHYEEYKGTTWKEEERQMNFLKNI